jgi:hypothetical protein
MRGDTRERKGDQGGQRNEVKKRGRSEDAKAQKAHAAHALDQRKHIQQTRVADGEGFEKPSARGKAQKKRTKGRAKATRARAKKGSK